MAPASEACTLQNGGARPVFTAFCATKIAQLCAIVVFLAHGFVSPLLER